MRKTYEQDLAEKLHSYRQMSGWCSESELVFMENFCGAMYSHLVSVDGHEPKVARKRIDMFRKDVEAIADQMSERTDA